MKLHRIGVLMISLVCLSTYAHALPPAERDGDINAGSNGTHRQRSGGGDDGGGRNGSDTRSHASDSDATVQAIVDYCARIDSSHRNEYAQLGALAIGNNGRKGEDDDYQQAYANVSASLQKVVLNTGVETCKAGIAGFMTK